MIAEIQISDPQFSSLYIPTLVYIICQNETAQSFYEVYEARMNLSFVKYKAALATVDVMIKNMKIGLGSESYNTEPKPGDRTITTSKRIASRGSVDKITSKLTAGWGGVSPFGFESWQNMVALASKKVKNGQNVKKVITMVIKYLNDNQGQQNGGSNEYDGQWSLKLTNDNADSRQMKFSVQGGELAGIQGLTNDEIKQYRGIFLEITKKDGACLIPDKNPDIRVTAPGGVFFNKAVTQSIFDKLWSITALNGGVRQKSSPRKASAAKKDTKGKSQSSRHMPKLQEASAQARKRQLTASLRH